MNNNNTLADSEQVSTDTASHVIVERKSSAGLITLNRPKALNALSLDIVRHITQALLAWQNDPQVLAVAVIALLVMFLAHNPDNSTSQERNSTV